jgi:predicted nicotinamide N-methyase
MVNILKFLNSTYVLLDKGTDVTGHKVWPASMVLGLYLVKNREKFADKTILEVGAGTGKI